MNQLAFMLYDSRSGSTLLAALLDQYKGVSVSQESGFIFVILEHERSLDTDDDLKRLIDRLYMEVQFRELNLERTELLRKCEELPKPYSKKQIIEAIIDLYFRRRDPAAGCRVVKGPRIFFHLKELMAMFPDMKLVHIIRDARAVFNSKKTMRSVKGLYTENNLLKAAADWKKWIRRTRSYPDRIIEIRYEDMIDDPDKTMSTLLDFLAIPADMREKTKKQEDYANIIGSKQQHLHPNVGKQPRRELKDKWRETLSQEEIYLYEIMAGDYLRKYRYTLLYAGQNPPFRLRVKAGLIFLYYVFHYVAQKICNIAYYAFVEKSLLQKVISKLHEYR